MGQHQCKAYDPHFGVEYWAASTILNHPGFANARAEYVDKTLALYGDDAFLNKLLMEAARIVMRRFLWSLNDESGGIGWGAPEAMAECMCRDVRLADEYAHMLVSYMREDGEELCQDGNFIEHPLLQRGVVWGVARLAGCRREVLQRLGAGQDLGRYLGADDPVLRGLAALAVGRLGETALRPPLQGLRADSAPLRLYDEGGLCETTVGALVRAALEELK